MANANLDEDSHPPQLQSAPGLDELVSALMDGELLHHDAQDAIAEFNRRGESWRSWSEYHLIGDALRGAPALSSDVAAKVALRLADEPALSAPRRVSQRRSMIAWSAAASLVAVVGWVTLKVPAEPAAGPSASPLAATVAKLAPQQLRWNVGEYLIAHQEFSPGTAVQAASPYQRAAYETQQVDVAR